MKAVANVNGEITALKDARISVMDRGFLFGDSIYEVIRTYRGIPFFLEEHTDRLENSARLAKMKLSQSRSFLHAEIKRTVSAAEPKEDVFIRYAITRGCGVLDLDPTIPMESSFIIFVKEIPAWNPEFYKTGMKLAVPGVRRNAPTSLDPNIKSGNYMNNILALAEAKEFGADDALILSQDKKLTEASNSNVFFILNGQVVTPLHEPATVTGNLRGLTRRVIAEVCEQQKIAYAELPLTEERLRGKATECFVSSATREIMPVCEVRWSDGQKQAFPRGGGPISARLQGLYKQFVDARLSGAEAWFKL